MGNVRNNYVMLMKQTENQKCYRVVAIKNVHNLTLQLDYSIAVFPFHSV